MSKKKLLITASTFPRWEGDTEPRFILDYADDLAQFIYDAYNSGRDIVCQCDYGQSRSAGCAAAIAEHFYKSGIEIFADFSRCPNKLIYHKMIDALNDFSHNNKIPDQRRV